MKKIIKWTIYILTLCIVVGLALCYLIIPKQTNSIMDKIIEYANTPIAIAGITTSLGGIIMFILTKFVLSNTKFGKKQLETMENKINEAEKNILCYKERASEEIDKYKIQFEELKEDCNNKVTIMYEQFTDLQNTLLNSLKVIPNKKLQSLIEEYEIKFDERKEELLDKTINTNKYVDDKIEEIKEKYENMFQEFINKVESTLNEETEND